MEGLHGEMQDTGFHSDEDAAELENDEHNVEWEAWDDPPAACFPFADLLCSELHIPRSLARRLARHHCRGLRRLGRATCGEPEGPTVMRRRFTCLVRHARALLDRH